MDKTDADVTSLDTVNALAGVLHLQIVCSIGVSSPTLCASQDTPL